MMSFRALHSHADQEIVRLLTTITDDAGQTQPFNPSVISVDDATVFAYRAVPRDNRGIRSYLAITRHADSAVDVVDLTAAGEESGIKRVADPKLFVVDDAVYATFNTGFAPRGTQNDIYIVRVFPTLGPMQRVIANFRRQDVEKNWAFVGTSGRDLRAIYQLHPYSEVVVARGALGAHEDLEFDKVTVPNVASAAARGLTIGTQPLRIAGDKLLLLAHERWSLRRKRSYFGHTVTIGGFGTTNVRVGVNRQRLIHSVRAALPRSGRHNPNLLSATYFSGLTRDDDDVLLGYGINDIDFSIARMKEADLWP